MSRHGLHYELENDRRESFDLGNGWPHGKKHLAKPATLAEAGFYFVHEENADVVKCFSCNKTLSEWDPDDDPYVIHYQKNPKCEWALGRCSVVLDKDARGQYVFTDKSRLPTARALVKARQDTFRISPKIWPPDNTKGHGANSKKMAEAGFVYTPQEQGDDCATCVYCETSLSGWEPEDSPLDEHRRRNVNCPIFDAVLVYDGATTDLDPPVPTSKTSKKSRAATRSDYEVTESDAPVPSKGRAKASARKTTYTSEDSAPPTKSSRKATRGGKSSVPPTDASAAEDVPVAKSKKSKVRATNFVDEVASTAPEDEPAPAKSSKTGKGRATAFVPDGQSSEDEPAPVKSSKKGKARATAAAGEEQPKPSKKGRAKVAPPPSDSDVEMADEASRMTRSESQHSTASRQPVNTGSKRRIGPKSKLSAPPPEPEPEPEPEQEHEPSDSEPVPAPKPSKSRKTKAKFNQSATESEAAPAPKKGGRKTKAVVTATEDEVSEAPPTRKATSRATRATQTATESEADVQPLKVKPSKPTRTIQKQQYVTETEEEENMPTPKPKAKSKATKAKQGAVPSSKLRTVTTESEYSEEGEDVRRDTDVSAPPLHNDSDSDVTELVSKPRAGPSRPPAASMPGHVKTKSHRALKSAPPHAVDEEEEIEEPQQQPSKQTKTTKAPRAKPEPPAPVSRRISIKVDDGLAEGEVLGLLPTKKKRVPKPPPQLEPERVEQSHFSSFAQLEAEADVDDGDDEGYGAAHSGGDGGSDDDSDELGEVVLPDLPAIPTLDVDESAADLGIDLGYEDPFLSPSKQHNGMRLVNELRTSTPTKNKNKGKSTKAKGKEKAKETTPEPEVEMVAPPSPGGDVAMGEATPVPRRVASPPASKSEDMAMQIDSPVKPKQKPPSQQHQQPSAKPSSERLVTTEPPAALEPSKTVAPATSSGPPSTDGPPPATPARAAPATASTPITPSSGMFIAKNKGPIIPPLTLLPEEELRMTVEAWVRFDGERCVKAYRAKGLEVLEGFMANAMRAREKIANLPLVSDEEDEEDVEGMVSGHEA